MRHVDKEKPIATAVRVEFKDGVVCFEVCRGATLAEISGAISKIALWHDGPPLTIELLFETQTENNTNRRPKLLLVAASIFAIGRRSKLAQPIFRPVIPFRRSTIEAL